MVNTVCSWLEKKKKKERLCTVLQFFSKPTHDYCVKERQGSNIIEDPLPELPSVKVSPECRSFGSNLTASYEIMVGSYLISTTSSMSETPRNVALVINMSCS